MPLATAQSSSLTPASSREDAAALDAAAAFATIGALTATSRMVAVTAGAANVKGAYAELSASTPVAAASFDFAFNLVAAGDYLFDIALGAAGSEVVLVSNILVSLVGGPAEGLNTIRGHIPLPIPASSRVAVRVQCTTAAAVPLAQIQLFQTAPLGTVQAVTYGAATADSGGTSVDPGAVVNTKGAWVELSAALPSAMLAALLLIGGQTNTVRTIGGWLVDIAEGAAGSESVVVPNLFLWATAGQDLIRPQLFELPLGIASGTRLAIRAQSEITDGTDRLFDAVLIGFGP